MNMHCGIQEFAMPSTHTTRKSMRGATAALLLVATLAGCAPAAPPPNANIQEIMLRASALESAGNYADALTDLDALLVLAPDNPDAHILRGAVLTALGRADEAAGDFQTALRLRPNAATIRAMQAIAYAQSGKHAAAQTDLSRALQLGLGEEQAAQVRKVIDDTAATQP